MFPVDGKNYFFKSFDLDDQPTDILTEAKTELGDVIHVSIEMMTDDVIANLSVNGVPATTSNGKSVQMSSSWDRRMVFNSLYANCGSGGRIEVEYWNGE